MEKITEDMLRPKPIPDAHTRHCYQGEYEGRCKYNEDDICSARPEPVDEKDIIDQKARAFYWSRNPGKVMMEGTRTDMVIGYRAGYEQAIVDREQEVSQKIIEFSDWLRNYVKSYFDLIDWKQNKNSSQELYEIWKTEQKHK